VGRAARRLIRRVASAASATPSDAQGTLEEVDAVQPSSGTAASPTVPPSGAGVHFHVFKKASALFARHFEGCVSSCTTTPQRYGAGGSS